MRPYSVLAALALVCLGPAAGRAQTSAIPVLNSRPGAAYTLYLNFGGFSFTGNWNEVANSTPGVTPAYSTDGSANFSTTEITNMRNIWSRVAEKYVAYNVNVTTADPAPAGSTDSQRQAFYDQQPRMMHTVIGGSGAWNGGGGVSYVGVAQNTYSVAAYNGGAGRGLHTNFVFSAQSPSNLRFVAEATAHEDGHALRLSHQSRWTGTPLALANQYDSGSGTGAGSFAPIMGNSYSAERGTWRVGATNTNSSTTAQNDASRLLGNTGIAGNGLGGFMDSGVGHTPATATPLPYSNVTIDSVAASGFIAPNSSAASPLGESNYTTDYFVLNTFDGPLSVTLRSGRSTLNPGTADPGATLNATLRLLAADGVTVLATSNSGVLTETITLSDLAAGTYYLQISSAGGMTDNGYSYFDMGSYFLTGTFTPTPEPGLILVAAAAVLAARRFRSHRPEDAACPSRS